MTANATAGHLVRRLIAKDWQIVRGPIFAYAVIGMVSLVLMSIQNYMMFIVGSILLLTVLVIVGAHLIMVTVVNERGQQTLPFIMSLPITAMQYTTAKLAANVGVFFGAWLAIVTAIVLLITTREAMPAGLIPFAIIVLNELFIAFALTLAVALISESEAMTTVVMTIGNVSISIFIISIVRIPAIGAHIEGPEAVWNGTALTIIGAEVAIVAALIAITYLAQSRKRDFL